MKGISAVIATILMLMITIALAGTAYLYITGVFTARTGVVVSVDPSTTCGANVITTYVKNDGTGVSGAVTIDVTYPNGTVHSSAASISSINAGAIASGTYTRHQFGNTSGLYGIRVSSGGSVATGSAYCAS